MERNDILKNLCIYDQRNPNKSQNTRFEEFAYDSRCKCANCKSGRAELAKELLKDEPAKEAFPMRRIRFHVILEVKTNSPEQFIDEALRKGIYVGLDNKNIAAPADVEIQSCRRI